MPPKPFRMIYAICMYASETFREGICNLHVWQKILSERYMQAAYSYYSFDFAIVMSDEYLIVI